MKNKPLEQFVLESKEDKQKLNELLDAYKPFIASCAQKVSQRFLQYGSDDELSIAMIAFTQAVDRYQPEHGDFLSYAEIIIRNKVIDYYRSQNRHLTKRIYLREEDSEKEEPVETQASLAIYGEEITKNERITEIQLLKESLALYDIDFYELENVAPKNRQTKQVCREVISFIKNNPILLKEVLYSKNLPLVQLEKELRVKRKKFERHRKYILAVLIIKSGDYPYLAEYVKEV